MADVVKPALTTTDWNEEWKALQTARAHPDDATEWNERSKTFHTAHGTHSNYSNAFLQLAGVRPGETVFDMGCGTGALAIPLGADGHRVIAADFASGMIDVVRETAAEDGIDCIETHVMSWSDDWAAHGLEGAFADVAFASRSIATADLQESLLKLHRAARRRVCITLPLGASPRVDEKLLTDLGLQNLTGRDFVYAFNILVANDIHPEINYIPSRRKETFSSPADAVAKLENIVRGATRTVDAAEVERALASLPAWVDANLIQDGDTYRLAEERIVTWAFISWDK